MRFMHKEIMFVCTYNSTDLIITLLNSHLESFLKQYSTNMFHIAQL